MNKKVLGMTKDECNENIVREFIALRAKIYSVKIDRVRKEIKGVKDMVTARLSINDFRKCLLAKRLNHGSMYLFKSKVHQV